MRSPRLETRGVSWILPPLSSSWIIIRIIWLHIALNRTPYIDCYWVGAVPKVCLAWVGSHDSSGLLLRNFN